MSSKFIHLTECDKGGPIYVRKDMVAAVGSWLGKTYIVLTVDDVDYQVKESPEQVLRLLEAEPNGSLTNQHSCGTIHARRRNQNGVENRSKSKAVPAERGSQGPEAVQPLERDAPPVL